MTRDLDGQRVVWLFGKAYWWGRLDDGRLVLEPAVWIEEEPDA